MSETARSDPRIHSVAPAGEPAFQSRIADLLDDVTVPAASSAEGAAAPLPPAARVPASRGRPVAPGAAPALAARTSPRRHPAVAKEAAAAPPDRLTLRTAEGPREFASSALQTVRLAGKSPASGPNPTASAPTTTPGTAPAESATNPNSNPAAAVTARADGGNLKAGAAEIELADGSRVTVESFASKSGKATGNLIGGQPFEFRVRTIRAVRFAPATASFNAAWATQLETKIDGDTIIIRRKAKPDSPATLDRQSGIVQEISADTVQFELDGDRIPLKRERLEGVLFFQPADREWPDPVCRLDDRRGASWRVKSIRLEGAELALETVAGAAVTLPLAELRTADFSSGNVQFLSDLEPDSIEWSPFIESRLPSLKRFNQPRRDVWPGGAPLAAGGESFAKGLAIRSRTNLVYRVPRNFRRFEAQVGIDERLKEFGAVKLTILGDGNPLFDAPVTGKDKMVNVSLDVSTVRRLAIVVDFGEEGDRADWLVLGNARVTK